MDWLQKQGIEPEYRNIQLNHPGVEELKAWQQKSALPLKRFFNTSGLVYRSLELGQKLPQMDEEEMFALLSTDGMLVKRPLLIGEDFVLVGFKEQEWEKQLGSTSF